jgi:hypothetical protein
MKSPIDRIQEFINWLEETTDFGEWNQSVKTEVHKALIVFMISDSKEPTEDNNELK